MTATMLTTDRDANAVATALTAAMRQAMLTEAAILAVEAGHPVRRGDVPALTNAGMVGWQAAVYRLLNDTAYDERSRGLVLAQYRQRRGVVLRACRQMAKALAEA